ncbi:MAG TPA: lysylphosphatidylglycerol synthase transmembrane domain-containing protein, partial [Vicinamibacterales bacterium]|nr:lysylphosphatidylglycerol synthase transmembrane domain-containing protein [Vicinamibacterales bacterium]
MMTGRRAVWLGVATALAAGLLYYSLRGIEWRQVARTVSGAEPGRLMLAAALATVSLFFRAFRWRLLLNAEGTVSVPTAFWATAAGYFGNNFLPARGGELVRTLMISSRSALDSAYVLATALSERVADAIALVVISAAVLLALPAQPGWLAGAARPFAILGLLGAGAIAILPLLGSVATKAIERAPLPQALRPRLMVATGQALRGLQAFHDGRRLSGFLGLTVVIWCLDALGTIIAAAALGLAMSIPVAFLLMAGLGVASALPSTPGYVGLYQFVAVTVLTPFGFSRNDAIAFILVVQALMYVVIGFWGALGLWR